MLSDGTRLGPYEITGAIGAGGMGEVYRAHDSKLGRDVALKVLPEAFARDAERLARFQREAKVLASFNHPNIAAIYGFEDSGGTHALVMEFVEGPTLADRIKQGPIPVDEALRIAKQICEALEYAHEHAIVHRDLKPANVKVTNDDAVKVLDFGLAKAVAGEAVETDISTSPTLTHMATQAGFILGTAAYMSPEQAKGKAADRRADIWAFGCVLYEMLTGKMAFSGETVTDTLAAVVMKDPDWSPLPSATPARVRVLLQRCLQKDPKQRLRDIGDARISIEEVLSGAPETSPSAAAALASVPFWRRALPWALAGLVAGALIAGLSVWKFAAPAPKSDMHFSAVTNFAGVQAQPAISPDGRSVAFVSNSDGHFNVYVGLLRGGNLVRITRDPNIRIGAELVARWHDACVRAAQPIRNLGRLGSSSARRNSKASDPERRRSRVVPGWPFARLSEYGRRRGLDFGCFRRERPQGHAGSARRLGLGYATALFLPMAGESLFPPVRTQAGLTGNWQWPISIQGKRVN